MAVYKSQLIGIKLKKNILKYHIYNAYTIYKITGICNCTIIMYDKRIIVNNQIVDNNNKNNFRSNWNVGMCFSLSENF